MRRVVSQPRPHWQERVEEAGLLWHSSLGPYWNESAFYEFDAKEADLLESSTNELAQMALAAAQYIIDQGLYAKLGIASDAIPLIEKSWKAEPPSLYGRFDLAFDGIHPPKLLEYNADTPSSLLEAAVVQWFWLQDAAPQFDQYNSIHERLIDCWKELIPHLPGSRIDFCSMDDVEDGMTVTYLMDTAEQAGLESSIFPVEEIGWDSGSFVGPDGRSLGAVFKLYPWEWMVREEFGKYLLAANTIWIEPAWKMLLSNKGILPVLWELFPGHPNLLSASFDGPVGMEFWVRKPLLGREGANITLVGPDGRVDSDGDYGEEGFVYQELAPVGCWDGKYPVIGSWVVGQEEGSACGIGVRESETRIVTNMSQFVPHVLI